MEDCKKAISGLRVAIKGDWMAHLQVDSPIAVTRLSTFKGTYTTTPQGTQVGKRATNRSPKDPPGHMQDCYKVSNTPKMTGYFHD